MNILAQIAVAAAYGLDRLRADGVPIDTERFNDALRLLGGLSRLVDSPLSSLATGRKLPDDGHMTAIDVADRIGVTPTAVRLAARTGRLEGCKQGDRWIFTEQAVADWEARRGR